MKDKRALYIIDEQYKIRYINEKFKEYYPDIREGSVCYQALAHAGSPCQTCPITKPQNENTFYNFTTDEWVSTCSVELEYQGNPDCHAVCFRLLRDDKPQNAAGAGKLEKELEALRHIGKNKVLCRHTDRRRSIFYASEMLAEMLGYSSFEEMNQRCGDMFLDYVHPDDIDTVTSSNPDDFYAGMRQIMYYRMRRSDGSWLNVVDRGRIVADDEGKFFVLSVINGVEDILREQAELEMQNRRLQQNAYLEENEIIAGMQERLMLSEEQEMKLNRVIKALSSDFINVYQIDLDKLEVEVIYEGESELTDSLNQGLQGSKSFEDYLKWYSQTVCEEDRQMYIEQLSPEAVRKALEEKSHFVVNYQSSEENEGKYYQMKCVRLETGDSKAIFGLRCIDDEVKKDMEQKRMLSEALAQAQYANKAKTTFLNNMSHDIRTPMNAIIGYAALAATHIDNRERVADYIKKITQSSNHLLSLINDVLDMSRIESGKMSLAELPENIAEIMRNLRNIIQADIRAKQFEFYIDTVDVIDEDIYCDKLRINQILLNLLSNAIKFTEPRGTISVQIRQKEASQKGYAVYEFRVKDTGIGMNQDFLEHIFEPFSREHTSTVSGIQGTGLGMSITKNIVDMYGGTIEVNSMPGRGTEFVVSLPLKLQTEPKEIENIRSLEGMRALVVDDDMNTCQSVSKMLRQIGLRAEWTMYGKEAVVRAKEAIGMGDCYQVYIIDWLMPDMNGIETARRLRKLVGDTAPVILLSAYDWADVEDEAREAGVTCFISKPLFLSELSQVLVRSCVEGGTRPEEKTKEILKKEAFAGKRVLLVEDNEINQEISVEILTELGLTVDVAANGQIAVDRLAETVPGYYELILMDIQMPVMNGYDATRAIRRLDNRGLSEVPVIAMTANAYEEDKKEALEAGMNGHIAKPIEVPKLLEILETFLLC